MELDVLFVPAAAGKDKYFDGAVVAVIDILRASSTICAALFNNAREVIPVDSLEAAASIYHTLDRSSRFIGGERNSTKPASFDAGNSPAEYIEERVKDKSIVLTTTNGTKVIRSLPKAKEVLIGSFVNFSEVVKYINSLLSKELPKKFVFLCAGDGGRFSYEDTLCAGAFITELSKNEKFHITDQAHAAMSLYNLFSNDLSNFIKNTSHGKELVSLDLQEDIHICTQFDRFPVLPKFDGYSFKNILV